MVKRLNSFIVVILLIAAAALFSFKQYEQKADTKEIITIMATNRGKDKLVNFSVSVDASTSRRQRLIKSEEMYDYSGVLKIVKEYQDRGWEMKSSNMATSNPQEFFLYFLLEK